MLIKLEVIIANNKEQDHMLFFCIVYLLIYFSPFHSDGLSHIFIDAISIESKNFLKKICISVPKDLSKQCRAW